MKRALIFIFLFQSGLLLAAFEKKIGSPEEAYSGGAFCAALDKNSRVSDNPAALAFNKSCRLDMSQSELFSMGELKKMNASVAVPFDKLGAVALSASDFGNDLYKEQTACFAFGLKAGENTAFGAAVKNNILRIRDYGSESFFSFDAGVAAKSGGISMGFCAANIVSQSFASDGEKPAKSFRAGAGFDVLSFLKVYIDAEKIPNREKAAVYSGVNLRLGQTAVIGAGYFADTRRFGSGLSFNFAAIGFSYACVTHPFLGYEHHFALNYVFYSRPQN